MPEMIVSGTELRTLIEDAMRFRDEKTNGQFKVIDTKLDGITLRLDKINGTVASHEKIINERAIVVADYMDHAKEAEDIEKRLRAVEDTQLTQRSIKKWIVGTIGVTGTILAIIIAALQFFNGK
ncbi:MAG: hypothetical protein WC333_01860 [Dehalococcoidia bacterium]|jgi:hypothetical protein